LSLKRRIAHIWARQRAKRIARLARDPAGAQQALLQRLVRQARATHFGREHGFDHITDIASFQERVPIRGYEGFRAWIDRIYHGERDVLWPGLPLYFATTSGTTSGAKYIPISKDSMPFHVKGARDALLLYIHDTGRSAFLDGKMMFLSGSPAISKNPAGIRTGRLSGIANHYVPNYLKRNRLPSYEANVIEDWEQKVARIVAETRDEDLRLISGIPPWVQMFFERLQEQTGRLPIENWPNLQTFVQGGVDYRPYEELFYQKLGRSVDIVEVYPASEGFIAVQSTQADNGLQLMLDYGIFFEFIPLAEYGSSHARRLTIDEVALEEHYALVLTTNAGLWAYDIGDTVKFTSLQPPKIRVTGRVKHFISAFGEHVIQEEVNNALLEAVDQTEAQVQEFTVAPYVGKAASYHEWLIEFTQPPADLPRFAELIDQAMQRQNPYYKDLRDGNMLARAQVRPLQLNANRAYMKAQGRLGGQNKFPRLANDRSVADFMQPYILEHQA
jgi:hypothetical protein